MGGEMAKRSGKTLLHANKERFVSHSSATE